MTRTERARLAACGMFAVALSAPLAAAAQSEAPVATSNATADQISNWIAEGAQETQPLLSDPRDDVVPERRIHGEVGASVGNRGYGGYAAAQMPLGRASALDVAVAGEHYDDGRWGKGDRKSLFIGLMIDGDDLKNLISRRKCNVPRWGVKLQNDPVVLPDGSCVRPDPEKTARAGRRNTDMGDAEMRASGRGGDTLAFGP